MSLACPHAQTTANPVTQTYLLGEHGALDVGIVLFKHKGSKRTAG